MIKLALTYNGKWEVLEDFSLYNITVPKGFITDGASVPRFLWFVGCPMQKSTLRAAILHDYLYKSKEVSKMEADWLFLLTMKYDGVGFIKRNIYYLAVSLCHE